MTLQSHSWAYIQRKTWSERINARVFTSLRHLYTIAKTCEQPKCPSTEKWIKKMWCIYTIEYYLATKKNETKPSAAIGVDLEIVILSKVRQRRNSI